MKKLLSALAATLIVSSSAATVVSCGSKPVDSLSANAIKGKDGKALGYDITNWDASVLAAADFKNNFLANVNDEFTTGGSTSSLTKLLEVNDKDKHAPIEGSNIVAKILAAYESDQANQNKNIKDLKEDNFKSDFNITIYDENNDDTKIASWDGSSWEMTKKDDKEIGLKIVSFTDDSGQYVYSTVNLVNFAVEITPVGSGDEQNAWNKDNFVGAKANLKTDDLNKGTDKYYNNGISKDADATKNAALYDGKTWKSEKNHDYRYMIEFNFSAK